MGLISKHLCKAHRTYIWHTHTNALDDPTRPSGAPGHGIQPVLALMWYNQIFKIILPSFYLIILGQVDNTSQRKLAHIQRLILLNYCFNPLTDITVSTLFLANMRPVSTTGLKVNFILVLHFSRHWLLAYNLEKYLHLVPTPRSTTKQLTHGCRQQILA